MDTFDPQSYEAKSSYGLDDSATKIPGQSPTQEQPGILSTPQSYTIPNDMNSRADPILGTYTATTYPTTSGYDQLTKSPQQGTGEYIPREGKLNLEAIASRTDELLKNVENALQRSQMLSSKIREKNLRNSQVKPTTTVTTTSEIYGNIGVATSYNFEAKPFERAEVPKSSYEPLNRNIESIGINGTSNYELPKRYDGYKPTYTTYDLLNKKTEQTTTTVFTTYDIKRVQSDVVYNPTVDVPRDYTAGYSHIDAGNKRYDDLLRNSNDLLRAKEPSYHQSPLTESNLPIKESSYHQSQSPLIGSISPIVPEGRDINHLRANEARLRSSQTGSSPNPLDKLGSGLYKSSISPSPIQANGELYKPSSSPLQTDTGLYRPENGSYVGNLAIPTGTYSSFNPSNTAAYSYAPTTQSPNRDTDDVSKRVSNVMDEIMKKYYVPGSSGTTGYQPVGTTTYTTYTRVEQPAVNPSYNSLTRNGAHYPEHTGPESITNYQSFHDSQANHSKRDPLFEDRSYPNGNGNRLESPESLYHSIENPHKAAERPLSDHHEHQLQSHEKSASKPRYGEEHSGHTDSKNMSLGHSENRKHYAGDLLPDESPLKKPEQQQHMDSLHPGAHEMHMHDQTSVFDFDHEFTRFEDPQLSHRQHIPQQQPPKPEGKPPRDPKREVPRINRDQEVAHDSKVAIWLIPKGNEVKDTTMSKSSRKLSETMKSTGKVPLISYCFDKFPNVRFGNAGKHQH